MPNIRDIAQGATFGFELELARGARDMLAPLRAAGLTSHDHLHAYHCDCTTCMAGRWALKAQADSSCSGELISRVFEIDELDNVFLDVVQGMERAAFEVDAVAGQSAGFHVHVSTPDMPAMQTTVPAFILVENALMKLIAPGPMKQQRPFNIAVLASLAQAVSNRITFAGAHRVADDFPMLIDEAWTNDRHVNLWWSDRYSTKEFRLWNSTRSAWRMEMYVRLSLLMATWQFVEALPDALEVIREWFVNLVDSNQRITPTRLRRFGRDVQLDKQALIELVSRFDDRAAELLERQATFHERNFDILPVRYTEGDDDPIDSLGRVEFRIDPSIVAGLTSEEPAQPSDYLPHPGFPEDDYPEEDYSEEETEDEAPGYGLCHCDVCEATRRARGDRPIPWHLTAQNVVNGSTWTAYSRHANIGERDYTATWDDFPVNIDDEGEQREPF